MLLQHIHLNACCARPKALQTLNLFCPASKAFVSPNRITYFVNFIENATFPACTCKCLRLYIYIDTCYCPMCKDKNPTARHIIVLWFVNAGMSSNSTLKLRSLRSDFDHLAQNVYKEEYVMSLKCSSTPYIFLYITHMQNSIIHIFYLVTKCIARAFARLVLKIQKIACRCILT